MEISAHQSPDCVIGAALSNTTDEEGLSALLQKDMVINADLSQSSVRGEPAPWHYAMSENDLGGLAVPSVLAPMTARLQRAADAVLAADALVLHLP